MSVNKLIHGKYAELPAWRRLGMKGLARTLKIVVASVAYLSLGLLLYLVFFSGTWNLVKSILACWCIGEICFFLYWKHKVSQPFHRKPCAFNDEERLALCQRLVEHVDDMEDMLTRWLVHKPPGEVHLDHFIEWIVWMMFDKRQEHLTTSEESQLRKLLPLLAKNINNTPQPQHKSVPMRPSMDPMRLQPKPLVAHLFIKCVHALGFWKLRSMRFNSYVADDLSYWYLHGESKEPPILYIHGIGIGFAMYMAKLIFMGTFHKQRRIILIELPHISMDITNSIPDHDETLSAIDMIFRRHAIDKVSLMGHSYGTVVATWIVRNRPQYLSRLTLVDPVCFCIWDSTLARNFLYSKPLSFIHELALFFVARDPLITHTVSKELYWYESVLYPEDIPVPTEIFLSINDWVVDAAACTNYLKKRLPVHCNIQLMETTHGGCLANKFYYSKIIQAA